MTNHELLAGFLERSLSEDALLEFEARQAASPEFAAEVREMLTVENILATATPQIQYPVELFASVESAIAAKVAAASTPGLLSTLAQNAWTWIAGGTAAVVIGGGAVYMTSNSAENEPSSAHVQRIETVSPAPKSVEGSSAASPQTIQPAESNETRAAQNSAQSTATQTIRSQSGTDNVNVVGTTNSPDAALSQTLAEYERCTAANDHVRCAQIALVIGKTYRQGGQFSSARTYFESAIAHARTLRLSEYEMSAWGELGVLAKAEGNLNAAADAFRTAVEIGVAAKRNTDRWNAELQAIESH